MLHTGRLAKNFFDALAKRVGPLQRGGIGQLRGHEGVTLVLLGYEGRREATAHRYRHARDDEQANQSQRALADECGRKANVTISSPFKYPIESVVKSAHQCGRMVLPFGFEPLGGECRAEG